MALFANGLQSPRPPPLLAWLSGRVVPRAANEQIVGVEAAAVLVAGYV